MEFRSDFDLQGVRRDFVGRALRSRFGSPATIGQYARLLETVSKELAEWALQSDDRTRQFEGALSEADDLIFSLKCATGNSGMGEPTQDVWKHHEHPFQLIRRATEAPNIYRIELESVVAEYLEKSWRSKTLDSVLVDALVAAEMYAFGKEMYGNVPPWLREFSRSPILERHALGQFAVGVVINLLLVAGLFAIGVWAATSWVWWIVGVLIAAILVFQVVGVILLPMVWRRQAKRRKKTHELMNAMLGVYSNLGSVGPASAAFIRKCCEDASAAGVVWPAPLFALLDDVQSRGGTLG